MVAHEVFAGPDYKSMSFARWINVAQRQSRKIARFWCGWIRKSWFLLQHPSWQVWIRVVPYSCEAKNNTQSTTWARYRGVSWWTPYGQNQICDETFTGGDYAGRGPDHVGKGRDQDSFGSRGLQGRSSRKEHHRLGFAANGTASLSKKWHMICAQLSLHVVLDFVS